MEWNPVPHIQHGWEKATTKWGKVAFVLFYSFVWSGIPSAIWQIIDPTSFGMGCYIDLLAPEESVERDDAIVTMRIIDLLLLGLLIYADFGGFNTRNVASLTAILFTWVIFMIPVMGPMVEGNCGSLIFQLWIMPIWLVLALICMIMEDNLGDHGTGYTDIVEGSDV